jgi:hypothetical protein
MDLVQSNPARLASKQLRACPDPNAIPIDRRHRSQSLVDPYREQCATIAHLAAELVD